MRSNKTTRNGTCLNAAAFTLLLAAPFSAAFAQSTPAVSVGAGIRTSFTDTSYDNARADVSDFEVNNARIYISGSVTDDIKVMFNTDYSGADDKLQVMDAAAMFSFSDKANIWVGRFLPPSDRANLYGPFYASHWGVYIDGVQDGYPFEVQGRADGAMYWGQFGIAKLSFGAFDVNGVTKGSSDVLYAARAQFDFWDSEDGYYLNGTYYGEKDLLAIGFAGQQAGSDKAYSVDFLLEKKLGNNGVVTFESEYAKYDGLGGYAGPESDGWYALGAYLLPNPIGVGRLQFLAKYGETTYEFLTGDTDQETLELNVNYLIKQFNARVSLFYIDQDYSNNTGGQQIGLGVYVQI